MYLIALEDVVLNGVYDVEAAFRLYISCRRALPEGYAVDDGARLRVYKFQFNVLLLASYHLACAIVVNGFGAEQRLGIARTERREAL